MKTEAPAKRVVVIHWKNSKNMNFEVFSNLRNLCLSYPQYNYNTLNNYLGKEKIPYENDLVKIERKHVFLQPKINAVSGVRSIAAVVNKIPMKSADDYTHDLEYWLQQPVKKRLAAVTFLISQSLKPGQRMDKTMIVTQKLNK
jgi:hypothetical protein